MKKILCVVFMLLLVGCVDTVDVKPVTQNISFTAEMTYYNEYYEMTVDISDSGNADITVTHPKELDGLRFVIEDGTLHCEFEGLRLDVNDNHKTAAVNFLYAPFFDSNQRVYKKDSEFFVKGGCDGGEYIMYITESGLPLKLCDSADRFEVIIKNLKVKKEKEP